MLVMNTINGDIMMAFSSPSDTTLKGTASQLGKMDEKE